MTQKEFSKQVKALNKRISDGMDPVMNHKMTAEEYFKIHEEWKELCQFAKDNNLYMQ